VIVSIDGAEVNDLLERIDAMDSEGVFDRKSASLSSDQIRAFQEYSPERPARTFGMRLDQSTAALEGGLDELLDDFQYGDPQPRVSVENPVVKVGKLNFIVDAESWLIVGAMGHQLLSGGANVAAAGHLVIGDDGLVQAIHLNFSGHYRPLLDRDYVQYTYWTVTNHPLLTITSSCQIRGRKFFEDGRSTVLSFEADEIFSEEFDPERITDLFF
jgi:hypothetical protein